MRWGASDMSEHGSETLSGLVKRSFSLAGHRTSVALEPAFWGVLKEIAAARDMTLARLVASVDAARDSGIPLASSLRVLALRDAPRRVMPAEPSPDLAGT